MEKLIRSRSRLFLALLAVCTTLPGQVTLSTVRGTTADPSGGVVPGANIELTNLETNAKRQVKSGDSGDFEVPDLQRGTYRMTVTHAGFKTFVADNIILEGSQIRRINVAFELGAVGTQVTVRENAALIQTDSAKIQTAVDTTRHFDTPWVGGVAGLDQSLYITVAPLVNLTNGLWSSQWAGQNSNQVQEGQDGHTNDQPVNQLNDILDAQEVTVVAVNNTAEFARVGYMNLVTKSGTNEFHVRASYWNQNSAVGARQFFDAAKARQLIHTSSLSASGPIIKNKTFFFASGNILKVPSHTFYLESVPSSQMRGGDFSQLLALGNPVTVKDPLNGLPFPNNTIPANRISSVSQAVNQSYLPAPNLGGPNQLSNNYGFTFPFANDYTLRKDFTQRIDQQITSKNRIMGRVIENWDLYVLPTNFPAFSWTRVRFNIHTVVEDTHIFAPTLVNTVRVGFYKEKYTDGLPLYGVTPFKGDQAVKQIGLQGVNPKGYSAEGFPDLIITGYPTMSTQPGGERQNDHDWGYADNLTWNKGRHVFKFGGEYKPQSRFSGYIPDGNYGNFSFNGSLAGYGYADFLLGLPFTSTRLDPLTNRTLHDTELGLFVQDSYKVNDRLTLDLGLRWDRFGPPYYGDNLMYRWDPASGNVIVPQGTTSAISPLYPSSITLVPGAVRMQPSNTNFVPRIGAAYRINDKTVIRGGYGIFNETMGRYAYVQGTGPFQISETYQNVISNGQPLFSFPNPFPASLNSANVPSQSVTGYPLGATNGKIHQYNATIERQFKDMGFRLSYVGSHDYGMHYTISVDKPMPSLIPFTASRRPYPQYVGASLVRTHGQSKFNAMTVEVVRKVGQLTMDAHWTLASSYSSFQSGSNLESPYASPVYARDQFTPRQRFVMNLSWEIPVGKGRRYLTGANPFVNGILGGWQLYWIGYLQTGMFFSPTYSGSDRSNTNTVGGLPNRTCNGNLPSNQRSITHWFDPTCFTPPAPGTLGNTGPFVLEGPGYNMQHLSIAKTFSITERLKFTFTAAASNALNHPNFALPAGNISSPGTVGVISGLAPGGESRQIELRGRIDF
jgi:outer membrane receptor protein involved in Fe transport